MSEQGNEFELDVEGHKAGMGEPGKNAPLTEDVEGHRFAMAIGDGEEDADVEAHRLKQLEGDDDVEAHRLKQIEGDDDDVEGHRIIGSNVQPPRDTDLGGSDR